MAITDLLQILRNQGYTDLPQHAKTLLKTNNESNDIKIISTAKGHNGLYTYFGIEKFLSKMIETSEYDESFFKNISKYRWDEYLQEFKQAILTNLNKNLPRRF